MFLTDDIIRALPVPAKGNKVHFDQPDPNIPETADIVTPGLGLRVTAAGHRAWIFRYQLKDGSGDRRKLTLGKYPYISVANARKRARKLREEIEGGADPQGEKAAKRSVPTISKLADDYDAEQMALVRNGQLRMSTLEGYRRLIRLYIRPELGREKAVEISKQDVKRLHRKISATGKGVQANRVVALLSAMMGYAIGEEIRTDNPCFKAVAFNTERPRARDISPDERGRLTAELAKHSNPAANVLKFLMVTGARKSEAMNARWVDISFGDKPSWHRKAVDQKAGHDHTLVLNGVAAQLLSKIRDETIARDGQLGEFVFGGRGHKGHVVEIRKTWLLVLRNAGIVDLHVHDLRHHYASELASSGSSLPLIGALLGHRSASSTARYARLFQDAQREASDRAGAAIMGTETTGVVVPLKRGA
jgi:integrase